MQKPIDELDMRELLAAEEDAVRARRQAEVDGYVRLQRFADLVSVDPQTQPGAVPVKHGGDRLVQVGGDGTPGVAELAIAEVAWARSAGVGATANHVAAALDLRHRLPLLWAAFQALRLDEWVVRRVAALSRKLDQEQVALVDAAVAAAADESPSRILAIAEAKVIEADVEAHRERIRRDAARKGVWLRRPRPGQRVDDLDAAPDVQAVGMRLSAGGAAELEATIEEIAERLAAQHTPTSDDDVRTMDQLRAEAVELMARPHDAVRFLNGPDDPEDPEQPASPRRATKRRPATIHVHFHVDVLTGRVPGVARVEGIGPLLEEQVAELLRHRHVTVKPVIDLNAGASVNAYEHPTACKERTLLRTVGDVFPHSTSRATRRLDLDHPTPYDPQGPPGQTGDHNAAPLTRRHHRAKTFLAYDVRQLGYGAYRWRSPHGLVRVVTGRGTCRVLPVTGSDGALLGELYAPRVAIACAPP